MMTGSTSLEEQVALLAKSMKILAANVKEKDKQITFMINKIITLTGKKINHFGAKSEPKFAQKRRKFYQGCNIVVVKIEQNVHSQPIERAHQGSHKGSGGKCHSTFLHIC